MSDHTISFIRENKTIEAADGARLIDVMHKAGIPIDAPCGGQGKCGKCLVRIRRPEEMALGAAAFSRALACQTIIRSDLTVETIPPAENTRILTEGAQTEMASAETAGPALVFAVPVTVPPCPVGKSISDWTRFARSLSQVIRTVPSHVLLNPAAASMVGPLSRKAKSSGGTVWAVVAQDQPEDICRVLDLCAREPDIYMAAFDIGTTTVVGYLISGRTGKTVSVSSRLNPQTVYGADVISRAQYTLDHGTEEITHCIQDAVREMLLSLAEDARIDGGQIYAVSIAGNTCMHHLFLGVSVDSLVHSPYTPSIEEPMVLRAADYGLAGAVHSAARLYMLPNIAGFVGADTVACLVSTRLAREEDWTLLIDIGTNGEMVLGRQGTLAACSTAAGPAFEGAGISCGMRGSDGAISHVLWQGDHWEYEVIGENAADTDKAKEAPAHESRAKGICGSGLLDAVAQLVLSGQIDEYGAKTAKNSCPDDPSTCIAFPGSSVTLTVKDVRQVQLAKAAIATGVRLLAEKMGIRVDQIRKVWLAGAFGSFLSPDSACAIGLIPPELQGRITAVGNASGSGARMVLQDRENWFYAGRIARQTDFLELAAEKQFQDTFVDELMFPEV